MLFNQTRFPLVLAALMFVILVSASACLRAQVTSEPWDCQLVDGEWVCGTNEANPSTTDTPPIQVEITTTRDETQDRLEQRADIDWVPKAQLTEEQRLACPRGCEGAYIEPERIGQEANLDPRDAQLRAEAGSGEIDALTQAASLGGYVVFSQGWRQVSAETVSVDREDSQYRLEGDVSIREPGLLVIGDSAAVDGEDNSLVVTNANYLLHNSRLRGSSTEVRREGSDQFVIENATYTSCEPGDGAWTLSAGELRINEKTGLASARNVLIRTGGVPVFYAPYISYPIDDRPRSGLLYPQIKLASEDGFDYKQPIYWAIAENQDATFTPRYISERGFGLQAEHRFLTNNTYTVSTGSFFPSDQSDERAGLLEGESRWLLDLKHQGYVNDFWTEVEFSRVSDIDYFEDFGTSILEDASVSNLQQYGAIGLSKGNWDFSLLAENFQSLVVENGNEYRRFPELDISGRGNYGPDLWWQADYQYSLFGHARDDQTGATGFELAADGTWVTGQRLRAEHSTGWTSESDWYLFRPAIGVDYLYYNLDSPVQGQNTASPSELAPNASIDFGLVFERETNLFDRQWIQTLEPEIFYFFRDASDQSDIPLFDTTIATSSYDQLFRRNSFVGGDRLSDNHQITLGLSSSLYNNETGRELGRFRIAQAFFLEDRVVHASDAVLLDLTDPSVLNENDPLFAAAVAGQEILDELVENRSDLIATLDLNVAENWNFNSELIWDVVNDDIERSQVQFAYQHPTKNQQLSFSYFRESDVVFLRDQDGDGFSQLDELVQDNVEQASVTGIVELQDHWSVVSLIQQDFGNNRNLNSLVGLSFENCCWSASFSWRRWLERDDNEPFGTGAVSHDNGVFFSFEWIGLGGIGQTPLELLESTRIQ